MSQTVIFSSSYFLLGAIQYRFTYFLLLCRFCTFGSKEVSHWADGGHGSRCVAVLPVHVDLAPAASSFRSCSVGSLEHSARAPADASGCSSSCSSCKAPLFRGVFRLGWRGGVTLVLPERRDILQDRRNLGDAHTTWWLGPSSVSFSCRFRAHDFIIRLRWQQRFAFARRT